MFFVSKNADRVDAVEPEVQRKALRALLWFGLVSIIMLFAGLTSAYIVRQGEGKWVEFDLPRLFTVSSLIILLSSLSMHWALASIKKNDYKNLLTGLLVTQFLHIVIHS